VCCCLLFLCSHGGGTVLEWALYGLLSVAHLWCHLCSDHRIACLGEGETASGLKTNSSMAGDSIIKRHTFPSTSESEVACYVLPSRELETEESDFYFKRSPCLFQNYRHSHPCMSLYCLLFPFSSCYCYACLLL
jgi:hypothetical protein